jgi:hypothetical protein
MSCNRATKSNLTNLRATKYVAATRPTFMGTKVFRMHLASGQFSQGKVIHKSVH